MIEEIVPSEEKNKTWKKRKRKDRKEKRKRRKKKTIMRKRKRKGMFRRGERKRKAEGMYVHTVKMVYIIMSWYNLS